MRGTVAVDPSIVRFGSALKIPGYGFGRARDTGGAIVGRRLDVAMMSCAEAFKWGRRRVMVAVAQ